MSTPLSACVLRCSLRSEVCHPTTNRLAGLVSFQRAAMPFPKAPIPFGLLRSLFVWPSWLRSSGGLGSYFVLAATRMCLCAPARAWRAPPAKPWIVADACVCTRSSRSHTHTHAISDQGRRKAGVSLAQPRAHARIARRVRIISSRVAFVSFLAAAASAAQTQKSSSPSRPLCTVSNQLNLSAPLSHQRTPAFRRPPSCSAAPLCSRQVRVSPSSQSLFGSLADSMIVLPSVRSLRSYNVAAFPCSQLPFLPP